MKDSFTLLREQIDLLPDYEKEYRKGGVLLSNADYVDFCRNLVGMTEKDFLNIEAEFRQDLAFFEEFLPRLAILDDLTNAGDLRFHSFTLYLLVRALKPRLVVETGVAHGKSSSLILLALKHNGAGKLVSFDIPPNGNLSDGAKTTLSGRDVGWLVPENLRSHWELHLEDSVAGIKSIFGEKTAKGFGDLSQLGKIDIFFHDSLHTFEHITSELEAVHSYLSDDFLLLADNMEMESGLGFESFCQRLDLSLQTFGNLAGAKGSLLG